jgi:6,7-dimethyl-8-ribityllumazine synthase
MGERSHEKPREEDLDGVDLRVAVVVSRYNLEISKALLAGALGALQRHNVFDPQVVWVPGAMEIPVIARTLAESGEVDAIVTLGSVIKGETDHFRHVSEQCAAGIMTVSLDTGIPCAFGVLITFSGDQARARAGLTYRSERNHGIEAAETALEMANLVRRLQDGQVGEAPPRRQEPPPEGGRLAGLGRATPSDG